jgi:phosphoribosylformimino-5-aminoimidazole carboxamide ribonucleotide (ProFAR) isomerase
MLIPCIDLQGGQAVQLVHGRKRELAIANVFGLLESFGKYEWLHIIDLDAAMGQGSNDVLIRELCKTAGRRYPVKLRVGGGVRTLARARALLALGATQVIVGSAAFRDGKLNFRFLRRLRSEIPRKRIVIALDTSGGHVTTHGWRRTLPFPPEQVMAQLEPFCGAFLCTDVNREGTMAGANLTWFRKLRDATDHPIIAAGGICSRREVVALEGLGMDAAVGMAVYKGRLR